MKKLIIFTLVAFMTAISTKLHAEEKTHRSEKSLTFKAHIVKILMGGDKLYKLELREFAAVYHAEDKFFPCLEKSIKENKEVTLTVTSQSLVVMECTLD